MIRWPYFLVCLFACFFLFEDNEKSSAVTTNLFHFHLWFSELFWSLSLPFFSLFSLFACVHLSLTAHMQVVSRSPFVAYFVLCLSPLYSIHCLSRPLFFILFLYLEPDIQVSTRRMCTNYLEKPHPGGSRRPGTEPRGGTSRRSPTESEKATATLSTKTTSWSSTSLTSWAKQPSKKRCPRPQGTEGSDSCPVSQKRRAS